MQLMVLVAVLGTASAASAGGVDPLRCEARKLRVESEFYQCVSRCDRRATRAASRLDGARPATADNDCETRCAARYDESMQRADGTSPCVLDGEPDAARCEARLLRVRASERICQSRCARRDRADADATACPAHCRTRCETTADDTLAQMVCAEGRMNASVICSAE
jgi:hypothetical protein